MKKQPKYRKPKRLSEIAIRELKVHGIEVGSIVQCPLNDDSCHEISSWDYCEELADGSIILHSHTGSPDADTLLVWLYDAESGEFARPVSDSPVKEDQVEPTHTPLPRIPAEKLQEYDEEKLWEWELQRLKTCKFQISAQTIEGKLIIQRDHTGYSQLEMLGILDIMRSELLKEAKITRKD